MAAEKAIYYPTEFSGVYISTETSKFDVSAFQMALDAMTAEAKGEMPKMMQLLRTAKNTQKPAAPNFGAYEIAVLIPTSSEKYMVAGIIDAQEVTFWQLLVNTVNGKLLTEGKVKLLGIVRKGKMHFSPTKVVTILENSEPVATVLDTNYSANKYAGKNVIVQ
jgi:hypothetical protein